MFAIGIPTINRGDLLNEALAYYKTSFKETEIFICDNGNQTDLLESDNVKVIRQEHNLGVSASWNMLLDIIFKSRKYALILNDDILLKKDYDAISNIITQASEYDFIRVPQGLCAFIISCNIYNKIGKFDENFYPAYYEDDDYFYRLKMAGCKILSTQYIYPEIYRNSQSIVKDENLLSMIHLNKARYIQKWGGLPCQEVFSSPFNT